MNTTTLTERFAGTAPAFQSEITRIAADMKQDALTVYAAWRRYSDSCSNGDMSAILGEFEDQYRTGHWLPPAGITVSRNIEKGGVEIRFPAKPEASMIERVKSQGFRWSRFSGCWWAKATDGKVAFAYSLAGQEQPKNGQEQANPEQSEQVRDPGEDAADRHSEAMGAEEVTERLMEMDAFTR